MKKGINVRSFWYIFFHIRQQQRPPRLCQPQLLATLLLPPFQPLAPRKKDPFLTPPLMVILIEKEKFWCHIPLQLKKKDVDNVLLRLFQVTNLQIWSCLPRPAADKTRCLTSTNLQLRTNLQIQIKSRTSIKWETTLFWNKILRVLNIFLRELCTKFKMIYICFDYQLSRKKKELLYVVMHWAQIGEPCGKWSLDQNSLDQNCVLSLDQNYVNHLTEFLDGFHWSNYSINWLKRTDGFWQLIEILKSLKYHY